MKKYILLNLLAGFLYWPSLAQIIGEEVEEKLPVFGLCLMPDNSTFITVEADYDGMYISQRELVDLFEKTRFNLNGETYNWDYYDYWVLNNRTRKTPVNHTYYSVVVDRAGKLVAVAPLSDKNEVDSIFVFSLSEQVPIASFEISEHAEYISPLTLLKFDYSSKHLLVGTEVSGTFSLEIDTGDVTNPFAGKKLQLIDYQYDSKKMIFRPYSLDEFGAVVPGKSLVSVQKGEVIMYSGSLSHDFTHTYSPTQMHKLYEPYYRQTYDTYISTSDGEEQLLLYQNKNTFIITSMKRKIVLKH